VSISKFLFLSALICIVGGTMMATPTVTDGNADSSVHKSSKKSVSKKSAAKKRKETSARSARGRRLSKKEQAALARRLRKMNRAFVASASLKPMARQLIQNRTPAAYAGVAAFARKHEGTDAGAMAYLVLGYARILDNDYPKAIPPLKKARLRTGELGDYADYFLATAYGATAQPQMVAATLKGFETSYPDSLFLRDAMLMNANALVAQGQVQEAISVLGKYRQPQRSDYEFALGRAYMKIGDSAKAAEILSHLYYTVPLADQSAQAGVDLESLRSGGVIPPASFATRKQRADLLAKAGHWSDAASEYRQLLDDVAVDDRPPIEAALGMALHRSGHDKEARDLLESMPDSTEQYDAERLQALLEMARGANDENWFKEIVERLRKNHAASPQFASALLQGGNMYLLKGDYDRAIDYYREMQERFPQHSSAAYAHWKTAWLSLRQGRNEEAAKLFEEQIARYPSSPEVAAAVYWRARLAEEAHDSAKARQYYEKLISNFAHYYYTDLARVRLAQLGASAGDPPEDPVLSNLVKPAPPSDPIEDAPADDVRVEKSKLLDNAGMFDFSVRELRAAAADGAAGWANREIARMFIENAHYDRALQTLKRAFPSYYALDLNALPRDCWEMLFPRPYWPDLKRYALANNLDPYLVAALIRQESEFNPDALSRANAFGLMQLLPSTGKTIARSLKVRRFSTTELLSPATNIKLGTRYFRDLVELYNGQYEYALAAYNAGTNRVDGWRASGAYRDPQEFVESIPFTETREYVQAILRNASIYHQLYGSR
jgi:peptidoglycan lytic transglycosylase